MWNYFCCCEHQHSLPWLQSINYLKITNSYATNGGAGYVKWDHCMPLLPCEPVNWLCHVSGLRVDWLRVVCVRGNGREQDRDMLREWKCMWVCVCELKRKWKSVRQVVIGKREREIVFIIIIIGFIPHKAIYIATSRCGITFVLWNQRSLPWLQSISYLKIFFIGFIPHKAIYIVTSRCGMIFVRETSIHSPGYKGSVT